MFVCVVLLGSVLVGTGGDLILLSVFVVSWVIASAIVWNFGAEIDVLVRKSASCCFPGTCTTLVMPFW